MSELHEYLEEEDFFYAIRIPANEVLRRKIAPLLTRPVGRPAKQPKVSSASFRHQAKTWTQPRRVVAKVEWHLKNVGFKVPIRHLWLTQGGGNPLGLGSHHG